MVDFILVAYIYVSRPLFSSGGAYADKFHTWNRVALLHGRKIGSSSTIESSDWRFKGSILEALDLADDLGGFGADPAKWR